MNGNVTMKNIKKIPGKPMDKEEKSKVGKGAKGRLVKQQSLPHDASTGSYFFNFIPSTGSYFMFSTGF